MRLWRRDNIDGTSDEVRWWTRNIHQKRMTLSYPEMMLVGRMEEALGWGTPEGEKSGLSNGQREDNSGSTSKKGRPREVPSPTVGGGSHGLYTATNDVISLVIFQCSVYVNLRLYLLSSRVRARAVNIHHRLQVRLDDLHSTDCQECRLGAGGPAPRATSLIWPEAPLGWSSHCQCCDRVGPTTEQIICTVCGLVRYCDKLCRYEDREIHQRGCKAICEKEFMGGALHYYIFQSNYGVNMAQCAECHHKGQLGAMKLCGRCRRSAYCGVSCQRAHWPEHREQCIPIQ